MRFDQHSIRELDAHSLHLARSLAAGTFALIATSCTSLPRIPYTSQDAASSNVLELSTLRRYADEPASAFRNDQTAAFSIGPQTYLALSGGGADGAYGAGVLNGWTETDTRPTFSIVSGVSTGALIAPFAFLGPSYDATLREFYTSGVAESLIDAPNILNAAFGSGLLENRRLRELVAQYISEDIIDLIGAEYIKGRKLFVVTTNLDSQRTVIWDMGRIASLHSTAGNNLFRDVVAASASVPVVFPPILLKAEANGKRFQEMHVDGSVTAPVLTLPEAFLLQNVKLAKPKNLQLYILINNKVERDFQLVPDKTIEIAARSSATVTKTQMQMRSILFATHEFAVRNKFGFQLTYIGENVPASMSFGFDTNYMRMLYEYGYQKARNGNLWVRSPPLDSQLGDSPSGASK